MLTAGELGWETDAHSKSTAEGSRIPAPHGFSRFQADADVN